MTSLSITNRLTEKWWRGEENEGKERKFRFHNYIKKFYIENKKDEQYTEHKKIKIYSYSLKS